MKLVFMIGLLILILLQV